MMMNPAMNNTNPPNGDELMSLEAEITELQRENARVESQMLRLKSDINAMETQLSQGERVRKLRLFEAGSKTHLLRIFFIFHKMFLFLLLDLGYQPLAFKF